MGYCLNCNHTLDDNATVCSKCGHVVAEHDDHATINYDELQGTNTHLFDSDINVEADDDLQLSPTLDISVEPLSDEDASNAGTGTVSAPGVSSEAVDEDGDIDRTLDVTELEEELEEADDHATIDAYSQQPGTYVVAPSNTTDDQPGNKTHVAGTVDPSLTEETPSDTMGTVLFSADMPQIPGIGSQQFGDEIGTVLFPTSGSIENAKEKTVAYGSTEMEPGTLEAGSSGTEGRLKRLWDDVAGSSGNPMHSLQASGLQASDSIFERVATRKVVDANAQMGATISDYQIINKLGEGAMGVVYSARQTTVDRVVAIKMAKPNFQQNEDARRRFLYEAQITADLDHSNIVPIHELGANDEGMLFYSMKLVQGTEWSRAIRKKTREQNVEIFMKVADAIAFAHSKGVIHRDLKPENTMLGRFGEVFVTDWGTAINIEKDATSLAVPAAQGAKFIIVTDGSKFRRGDSIAIHDGEELYDQRQIVAVDEIDPNRLYLRKKLTRHYEPSQKLKVVKSINMAGTPCYMAPEMAGHDLPKLGKTSDIYVLGAILYDIVMGKAPHTGKSVTECLRAALDNQVVVEDNDDPLLKIAYRAMESEPENRYQTVEELQEAVREYRRHAESIALSERSAELLELAKAKGDYEMFSRATFGYRDAVELWPENEKAVNGLKESRLAFGEAAFKKGDYDLVLQTVDPEVADEYALYNRAVAAKKKSENREKSLKLLQRVVAAVVLFAVVGLSGLSVFAFYQKNKATLAADAAKLSAESEKAQRQKAEEATVKETEAKQAAVVAQKEAEGAKITADQERVKAETAAMVAQQEKLKAEEAAKKEALAAEQEKLANMAAQMAKQAAEDAANLAKLRAAEIQLGEYGSSIALAKSQIESYDVVAGKSNLAAHRSVTSEIFGGHNPAFDNWGWQRINLLSNADLPTTQIGSNVSTSDYSTKSNSAVIGTKSGVVVVLAYGADGLTKKQEITEAGAKINAVAISPNGDEVTYAFSRGDEHGVKRWDITQDTTQSVTAIENRNFQRVIYSLDGKKIMAGINGGVWIWDRANNWFNEKPTRRIENLRGTMTNIQAISDTQVLVTAEVSEAASKVFLALLDLTNGNLQAISVPSEIETQVAVVTHTLLDNGIAIALKDNRLVYGTLSADGKLVDGLKELEEKHRAQVSQILTNGSGRMITSSFNEPVAHVWSYVNKEWQYDTYLTGTPGNLAGVGMLSAEHVLGVDAIGTSIVWDVQRQKQRRRLQRQLDGQSEEYVSPVQTIVAGSSDGNALAIDSNGVVDIWSMSDGSTKRIDANRWSYFGHTPSESMTDGNTQRINANRWSYFGHTPGAELVDSAVDSTQGLLITAARLKNAEKKYLANPEHQWEFCIWDAATGAMNGRWTTASRTVEPRDGEKAREESIEQRISLVDEGRQILFASDNETSFTDVATGKESFARKDFGSYFAVPHPQASSLVMLVKRSGAIRLLDLKNTSTWEDQALRYFTLADPSDIPLRGAWSADGKRFYLAYATGGLSAFDWDGAKLDLRWSSRRLEDDAQLVKLKSALSVKSGRVQSHLDIDLVVDSAESTDTVHIAIRNRGLSPSTKVVAVRFDTQSKEPALVDDQFADGVRWLQDREGKTVVADRVHDSLIVDMRRVRSSTRVKNQTFISTNSADVFALVDGKKQVVSYGRPKLIDTTGSRDGKTTLALLEDGAVWKFQLTDSDAANWQRLNFTASGAQKLLLSSDSSKLIVRTGKTAKTVDPITGATLQELGEVEAVTWDPANPSRLAVCRPNGTLELIDNGVSMAVNLDAGTNLKNVVGLHFFTESWNEKAVAARRHLLVHSDDNSDGYLQFVAIEPAPAGATQLGDKNDVLAKIASGSRVATSPTEGILITGAPNGTVAVWFATPTYESKPRQLFDLEGHRGAKITCLEFSSDGRTVVTADEKNRLYAWLSNDPLNQIAK